MGEERKAKAVQGEAKQLNDLGNYFFYCMNPPIAFIYSRFMGACLSKFPKEREEKEKYLWIERKLVTVWNMVT